MRSSSSKPLSLPLLLLSLTWLCPAARAAAPAGPPAVSSVTVIDEIDSIVRKNFYSPQSLSRVGWGRAVARARQAVVRADGPSIRTTVLRNLLATLGASHTSYYPRTDPAYWQLLGIFEPYIATACSEPIRPSLPVTVNDIGVFWKQSGEQWFVDGVYPGGPADKAGVRLGDEIVRAGDAPFSPVAAFAGKAGLPVSIDLRRRRDGPLLHLEVVPQAVRPAEALRKATQASWRIFHQGSRRIAYLHVWSWTSIEIQETVLQAITKADQASVDGFILDLRDGWGGANPYYLEIFNQDIPLLQSIHRDGTTVSWDTQIRKPAVILINGGTRSGKEIIAYGAKKHHLARLVGERTAGAVLFGEPFCLKDGSLLLLAVDEARVDGQRLEGVGVAPDIEVPFDVRYADGHDPQLQKALQLLSAGAR